VRGDVEARGAGDVRDDAVEYLALVLVGVEALVEKTAQEPAAL